MNSAEQDEEAEGSVTDHELVSGKQAVSSKSITSEESDQTSETSTSEDKLIGSPGMSPISSSSTNMDCDHVLDIPANENDFLKNENNSASLYLQAFNNAYFHFILKLMLKYRSMLKRLF